MKRSQAAALGHHDLVQILEENTRLCEQAINRAIAETRVRGIDVCQVAPAEVEDAQDG